jgi:predicted HAD superfamily Cof-like phosphohydrolase
MSALRRECEEIELMTAITHQQSQHQIRVEDFMRKAGQTIPDKPTQLDPVVCELRARLIFEEAMETIKKGLGVEVYVVDYKPHEGLPLLHREAPRYVFKSMRPMDLEETVDGCCDVSVVTIGTLSAAGVLDEPVLREIDQNNLDKFGPGAFVDESGKLRKPPNHPRPKLKECLIGQGWHPPE